MPDPLPTLTRIEAGERPWGDMVAALRAEVEAALAQARAGERERCAKICDRLYNTLGNELAVELRQPAAPEEGHR